MSTREFAKLTVFLCRPYGYNPAGQLAENAAQLTSLNAAAYSQHDSIEADITSKIVQNNAGYAQVIAQNNAWAAAATAQNPPAGPIIAADLARKNAGALSELERSNLYQTQRRTNNNLDLAQKIAQYAAGNTAANEAALHPVPWAA
jgi:hypothetical protein